MILGSGDPDTSHLNDAVLPAVTVSSNGSLRNVGASAGKKIPLWFYDIFIFYFKETV